MSEPNPDHGPVAGGVAASGLSALRLAANWAIAAVSLAVIAGFLYWTVNLGTRDPHEVPIIRAMEGPSRTQPDDPGGQQANHQGLAVNRVQADGSVAAPADEVVLAPDPDQLTEDDKSLAEAAPAQTSTKKAADTSEDVAPTLSDPEVVENKSEEDLDALEIADSVAEALAEEQIANQDPAMVPNDNIRGTPQSPSKSLRPKGRPSVLRTEVTQVQATVAATAPSETTPTPADEPGDTVAIGTRLIQLGAYDTADLARADWDKLLQQNADLLEDKRRLVIQAESGGRKFYRLRASGFNSLEDSRALCAALIARATPCIPVTAR
ncbi:MAG: SPOR domain-containing protein [Pseudomonadota bacterium]